MARRPVEKSARGGPDETLEGVILAALTEAEPNGLTARGIEQATGRHHAAVTASLDALAGKGRVRNSGRRAKVGKARAAAVWVLEIV